MRRISLMFQLDPTEERIISLVRVVCKQIPELSGHKFPEPVARICGGWVRDKILGKPSKDLDISIDSMTGEQFGNFLAEYNRLHHLKAVGRMQTTESRPEQIKNLAVSFVTIYGQPVEILSLRKEEYRPGDRNPIRVSRATPEEDALRRDLTINALFYNCTTGKIEDFTGKGLQDLKTLTLRTPVDPIRTFEDDPLRLLRVLRFHARYGGSTIAPEVLAAMKDPHIQQLIVQKLHSDRNAPGIVPERTAEELRKTMLGQQPEKAFRTMYETGLLGKLMNLPSSFSPMDMDQKNRHHIYSVIEHTFRVLEHVNRFALEENLSTNERMHLNFAALFHDMGKLDPRTHKAKPDGSYGYSGDPLREDRLAHEESSAQVWESFANALQLSNTERDTVRDVILGHMKPHAHLEDRVDDRALRRYMRKHPLWHLHYLHALGDLHGKEINPDEVEQFQEQRKRLSTLNTPVQTRKDLLDGKAIMGLVGPEYEVAPPKGQKGYIEVIKERIREAQDEDPSFTKDDASRLVSSILSSGDLESYRRSKSASWVSRLLKILPFSA